MEKDFINYIIEGNNYPPDGYVSFDTSDHIRFQNGKDVSGHNYGCNRRFVIEKNIQGGEGYTVTVYNLDGLHPIWKNNIQMAPKRMRIVSSNENIVEFRGYGYDENALALVDCEKILNTIIKAAAKYLSDFFIFPSPLPVTHK